MKILGLKSKLEKGKSLGGEVIYIKEDYLLSGIGSIYKDQERKNITLLKSNEESIKVDDFINILNDLHNNLGDTEILIGNNEDCKKEKKEIKNVEFAQYESIKMLFINI